MSSADTPNWVHREAERSQTGQLAEARARLDSVEGRLREQSGWFDEIRRGVSRIEIGQTQTATEVHALAERLDAHLAVCPPAIRAALPPTSIRPPRAQQIRAGGIVAAFVTAFGAILAAIVATLLRR